MVKQLTALILVLALANPVCGCLLSISLATGNQTSQEVADCCQHKHHPEETSEEADPQHQQDDCDHCHCEKPFAVADSGDTPRLDFKQIETLLSFAQFDFSAEQCQLLPVARLGYLLRPPPDGTRIHQIHCVFLT